MSALCCASLFVAAPAQAETLDELQAKADQATAAYNDATQNVDQLQAKIDEAQQQIADVESQLPGAREKAGVAMRSMYKMQQDTPGLVTLLLSSDSFSDFLTTYQYIDAVQRDNVDQTQQLTDLQNQLLGAQQTMQTAKDEATSQQQAAEQAMNDAQAAVDEMNAQIAAQKAAEEAAAKAQAEADAKAKADAEAAAQAQSEAAATQDAATTKANAPGTETSTNTGSSESPSTPSTNPGATDGSEVDTDGEWMIGKASAYSVADNTGGNATASGEILTDDSVTVAVPISQRYLLGRSVQIRYNGKTVTARVTDVGGFAPYGRALDLAGGVWKAFGFSSPGAWGVRAVQYRFL